MPSNQCVYEDSDSDIEDLHHVLEESRMQLKVADRSLRKKRKDPLKTGLYLNPGKYVSIRCCLDLNMLCWFVEREKVKETTYVHFPVLFLEEVIVLIKKSKD